MFKIYIERKAEKELKNLPKDIKNKAIKEILNLKNNPFPLKVRKIMGTKNCYRLKVGDYRIVYEVDAKEKIINIFRIRHRKDVYKKL